jgi:hypothetical protein
MVGHCILLQYSLGNICLRIPGMSGSLNDFAFGGFAKRDAPVVSAY